MPDCSRIETRPRTRSPRSGGAGADGRYPPRQAAVESFSELGEREQPARDAQNSVAAFLDGCDYPTVDRSEITAELVSRPVRPFELNGWDNVTRQLGGRISVRLPSGEIYAPRWPGNTASSPCWRRNCRCRYQCRWLKASRVGALSGPSPYASGWKASRRRRPR